MAEDGARVADDHRALLQSFLRLSGTSLRYDKSAVSVLLEKVKHLIQRDSEVLELRNESLCASYPPVIMAPVVKVSTDTVAALDGLLQRSCTFRFRARYIAPCACVSLSDGRSVGVFRAATVRYAGDAFVRNLMRGRVESGHEADARLFALLGGTDVVDLMERPYAVAPIPYVGKLPVATTERDLAGASRRAAYGAVHWVPTLGVENYPRLGDTPSDVSTAVLDGFARICDILRTAGAESAASGSSDSTVYDAGILIHCQSGWDRTPLFVSWIRAVAWAERAAHPQLSCEEMAVLVLLYDWMAFSHRWRERRDKGHDILRFSIAFLDQLVDERFTLTGTTAALEKRERLESLQRALKAEYEHITGDKV